jgi:hypothetical protein
LLTKMNRTTTGNSDRNTTRKTPSAKPVLFSKSRPYR